MAEDAAVLGGDGALGTELETDEMSERRFNIAMGLVARFGASPLFERL